MRNSTNTRWRRAVRVAHNEVIRQRSRHARGAPESALTWLFVAALPNSGSTALTRLLTTSAQVFTLEGRGEGQWLVPQMSRKGDRWNPDHRVDYETVRAVWQHRAARRAAGRTVVLEKSPSNIVRMRRLLDAFAADSPRLMVFTRDPIAVCASWAQRKTPETLVDAWMPAGTPIPPDEEAFFTTIGTLCGQRMSWLAGMLPSEPILVSYEAVTADPAAFAASLADSLPQVGDIDPTATLRGIKDYPEQTLRNMNDEQIQRLTDLQRGWLTAALAPFADAVALLGYAV